MTVRTDLALESAELYWETGKDLEIPGVSFTKREEHGIEVSCVEILNEEGERAIGKKKGKYVTISLPELSECDTIKREIIGKILSDELNKMILKRGLTLVAGLGNREITPDSLGPSVISNLIVTRHLFQEMPHVTENLSPVCALSPGVLGITGIETGEIIKGVAEKVKPDLIIVIDALASRKTERVTRTIQIADTGIQPGSGVGNKRKTINEETMGIPVIAIGVPTVVDALTIASDLLNTAFSSKRELESGQETKFFKGEDPVLEIKEKLPPRMQNMMVTPKDIDSLTDKVSRMIADGINRALHRDAAPEELKILAG